MAKWQNARLIPLNKAELGEHLVDLTDYEAARVLMPKVFRVKPMRRRCGCGARRLAIHREDLPGDNRNVCETFVLTD